VHEVCDEIWGVVASRLEVSALWCQEVVLMSDGNGSKEQSKPRLCERCGKRMPP